MVVLDSFPFHEDSVVQHSGEMSNRRVENSLGSSLDDEAIHDSSICGDRLVNPQPYLKCRLCHYQTRVPSLLRRHVFRHSVDSSYRCPACDFREKDPGKFVDHLGTHQTGRIVRCCFCPKKMSRSKLKNHVQIHRPVELYDCSMCQFSTNYLKTLKRHMDVYHTKEYSCLQCDMVMTKHDLHWHMKFMHDSKETEFDFLRSQAVAEPAEHALNSSITSEAPISTNQAIPPRKSRRTKISCKPSFALKTQKLDKKVSKKLFNCGMCDYRSSSKKLLRDHRAKHSLDNSLVCSKCDFKETGTGKFASHLSAHSPEGLIECCFCGFQTPRRGIMANHLCAHKPVPMFDCPECQFSARRPASLRLHIANVHSKKRRCGNCGLDISKLGWSSHKLECRRTIKVDVETAGPETENQPSANDLLGEGPSDNCVPCESCKKLYAKSYVRRHHKRCRGENASDPEPPNRLLDHVLEPCNEPVFIRDSVDHVESSGTASNLSQSELKHWYPKKPTLRCSSCFFHTKKKRLLKKHVVKHLIDFRLTCPECGLNEMNPYKFANHVIQHGSDPETFQCCFCSVSSRSKRSYCAHLETHRPVNIFDCPKCEYSSNRADTVRAHCNNNHVRNRVCQHCGKVMSRFQLLKHLEVVHGDPKFLTMKVRRVDKANLIAKVPSSQQKRFEDDQRCPANRRLTDGFQEGTEVIMPIQRSENDPTVFRCTECSFVTKIQSLMDRHIAKHLIDVPFVCPLCGFQETSSRKFANHWAKHSSHTSKMYCQCCFCDVVFKKKNCLKSFLPLHIEGHRAVALEDCSHCEFSSHSRYELRKHFKNQHLEKHECLLCGEVMTVYEYSLHTDCNDGGRNVKQPVNSELLDLPSSDVSISLRRQSREVTFSSKAAQKNPALFADSSGTAVANCATENREDYHLSNASRNDFMYCYSCDYKTKRRTLLKRHVQKHLIDVPFACSMCSFKTYDERTFVRHVFVHTESFNCNFCSFTATSISAAARHCITHRVLAMHDCPKCEFTSTYKDRLVLHLTGRHVDNPRCSVCCKRKTKEELMTHEMDCQKSFIHLAKLKILEDGRANESHYVSESEFWGQVGPQPPGIGCTSQIDMVGLSCNEARIEESHLAKKEAKLGSAVDDLSQEFFAESFILEELVQGTSEKSGGAKHQAESLDLTANDFETSPAQVPTFINDSIGVGQASLLDRSILEGSPVESSEQICDNSVLSSGSGSTPCSSNSLDRSHRCPELKDGGCMVFISEHCITTDGLLGLSTEPKDHRDDVTSSANPLPASNTSLNDANYEPVRAHEKLDMEEMEIDVNVEQIEVVSSKATPSAIYEQEPLSKENLVVQQGGSKKLVESSRSTSGKTEQSLAKVQLQPSSTMVMQTDEQHFKGTAGGSATEEGPTTDTGKSVNSTAAIFECQQCEYKSEINCLMDHHKQTHRADTPFKCIKLEHDTLSEPIDHPENSTSSAILVQASNTGLNDAKYGPRPLSHEKLDSEEDFCVMQVDEKARQIEANASQVACSAMYNQTPHSKNNPDVQKENCIKLLESSGSIPENAKQPLAKIEIMPPSKLLPQTGQQNIEGTA